jgi:carboxypeptidase C (cathepsin A)
MSKTMQKNPARNTLRLLAGASLIVLASGLALGAPTKSGSADASATPSAAPETNRYFQPDESTSSGSVSVEGSSISYRAVAGTLIVHAKGFDDGAPKKDSDVKDPANGPAEASMFYVAYFKDGARAETRPVTFVFNGGPGSATVWLHMGAFGPRRIVTANDSHTPAAPYSLINNDFSLLDASDLVFIDAPGTGFGRVMGKDKEKAFYGVDPDVHAFSEFITKFLSKYGRWNSPKYLFGESYGTPRAAALVNELETRESADFNGVILLSQILNYDLATGRAELNPSVDLPYELALPTYAATAWYHHKLPDSSKPLDTLLSEVENFALTDYALALNAGSELSPADRETIANKLHDYTGLPVEYILKANLRIDGGEFEKNLLADTDTTTGRLDTRFSGPTLDPLSKEADYDPQSAAISSAYISAFNDYVRGSLHYGEDKTYKPSAALYRSWDFHHAPPGQSDPVPQSMNVMPDLANAMKYNPQLKVMLNAGYYDLATPFFEGVYELHHLPMPAKLQANIEYKFYESGHMVYAHEESLKQMHDNVAAFIERTNNVSAR